MTNNKHPINSAKDMQTLKMRVPNSKAYIAMMQATGATTVAVDLSELYLALRQGVADGQDTPLRPLGIGVFGVFWIVQLLPSQPSARLAPVE